MKQMPTSFLLALCLLLPAPLFAGESPPLMLANVFLTDVRLAD